MRPLSKSVLLLLAILAGAGLWGGVVWMLRGSEPVEPPIPMPRSVVVPAPPSLELRPGVKGRERVLTPGVRHQYTFDLDRRTTEETAEGRKTAHAGWSGALEQTYLGQEGGQHLFSVRVVPTRVDLPALGEAARPSFQAMFEQPVYVAQDERGRVLSVHFDVGQDAAARRFVRWLLASTQFVAEAGTGWSTEETDAEGDFESEYHAGGSANTYVKTKLRYLRKEPDTVPPRTRGHLDFTLFESGHVLEVTGSEVVERAGARSETRVAMTCLGVNRHTLSLRSFQEARPRLRAESLWEREPSGKDVALNGATLKELAAVLAKRLEPKARAETHERLAALFRREPAEAEQAARSVRQGTAHAALASSVVEALGSAGTPESLRALASVLETSAVPLQTRKHAVRVAGGVERPTPELAEALTRMVDRDSALRDTATLAAGAVARGLALSEPARGSELVDGVLARCEGRKVAPEVCLRALANTGSPRALAYAKAALSHGSWVVRGAATDTLRAIPGAEPDALLDGVMLSDPDPRVRALAVVAISRRVAGPHLNAVTTVLQAEPSEQVRMEAVRMLGGLRAGDSSVEALLRDVAENDEAVNVRRLAATLLSEQGPAPHGTGP